MGGGKKVICFGELLLRLNAPGVERLLQTNRFDVHVGGAEANVAAALSQFGADAAMVSVIPDNQLGDAALSAVRRFNVDIKHCRKATGRMGLYFMSAGAVLRPSEILYDRAASAFANADPEVYDWNEILDGAEWLHVSGITPAVSANAAKASINAVKTAAARGVKVSFDGNYRAQLWNAWSGDGPSVLKEIIGHATIAFIDHRDIALVLDRAFDGDADAIREASRAAAFEAFPNLEIIASTARTQESVSEHGLSASLSTCEETYASREYRLAGVVDRIGAGDAFAASVLHSINTGRDLQHAIEFGMAASVLKHSIPGDALVGSVADVETIMAGEGLDVRR